MFPLIPSFLLRIKLDNRDLSKANLDKVLLIHGTQDQVIPFSHSKELNRLFPKVTELLIIEGGGHNDLPVFESYWEGLRRYLEADRD